MIPNLLLRCSRSWNKSMADSVLRVLCVLFALSASLAQGQTGPGFNHASTGFMLDGIHARLQCVDCHKTGVPSRGIPKDCNSCHIQGGLRASTAQLTNHIPTTNAQSCQDCHTQNSWTPALMRHTVAMQGQCARCHNGAFLSANAMAKPPTHIRTTASCDVCHTARDSVGPGGGGSWLPVKGMVHDATTAGRCSTCHNGTIATGKPATHITTTAQCDTCHTSTVTWLGAQYLHDPSTWGRCSQCHNGVTAKGQPTTHVPSNPTQCDSCHVNQVTFTAVAMNHTGMTGKCSTCHSGAYVSQNAQAKPATHVITTAQCDSSGCHASTTTWAGVIYSHTAPGTVYAGNCSTCHVTGGAGLAKPVGTGHIPTNQQCDTCHNNFNTFKPAAMSHTGTGGQCATCHIATYAGFNALPQGGGHIPTGAVACDVCHSTSAGSGAGVSWTLRTMQHSVVTGTACSTCHSGAYVSENALAKGGNHIPIGAVTCDKCHSSAAASFSPATMDHTQVYPAVVAACATCHGGAYGSENAQSQSASHVPTGAQPCSNCHTGYVSWAAAAFTHTAANATNCGVTCHVNAATAATTGIPKSTPHVPTSLTTCFSCHGGGAMPPSYANFSTRPFMVHGATMTNQCSTCHNATYAYTNANPQGTTHVPTAAQCDKCHTSTTNWTSRTMDHTVVTGTLCSTCHNGSYLTENALTKPATHVPTTAECNSCHASTTTWTGVLYSHTDPTKTYTNNCSSCHTPAGAGVSKPGTHIPTVPLTQQCDTCHKNFSAFKPAQMNHVGLAGQCSSCHNGSYLAQNALTKPASHVSTGSAANCDSSGCHTSTTTWTGVIYSHTVPGTTYIGNCSTCHTPGGAGLSKPTPHVPTVAQCDSCHTNYTAFKPAQMNHTGTAGTCATCHNGTYTYANAQTKATTHIVDARSCDTCHLNFVAFSPATMDHTGLSGKCSTCHSGTYLSENAQMKPTTHVATTAQCDNSGCHASTTTWAGTVYSHTDPTKTYIGNCSSCHTSGPGLTKPTNHVPTTQQCDTCHTNFSAFKPAFMNHVGTTGLCSNCHNGSFVFASADKQGTTHIPDARQCDTCHTSTVVWTQRSFVHPATAPGQCSSCHSGQYLSENAQTKPATHLVTTAQCDTCHTGGYTSWATSAAPDHTPFPPPVCSSCHFAGGSGLSKPSTHIPVTIECDNCHSKYPAQFKPAAMKHSAVTGTGCSACHSGTYASVNALPQGAKHIPTAAQCNVCHTTSAGSGAGVSWTLRSMQHSAVTGTACSTCHGGAYVSENALAKGANHIPIGSVTCDKCHSSAATSFSPATMDHTQVYPAVVNACATCHGGAYTSENAQAKPASGHVGTSLACNSSGCHSGYTTWVTGVYAHNQAGDATNCGVSCHMSATNSSATGIPKSTPHVPTTALCSVCHTMPPGQSAFKPAHMSHTGTAALGQGQCATCHNSTYAYANANPLGTTHIPTTAACDKCHTSTANWTARTMDHTQVTSTTCSTCHSGGYVSENADAKGSTHIPTSAQCNGCHTSTVNWTTRTMNHTLVNTTPCSTCHGGSYLTENAQAKGANHVPETRECNVCHTSTTVWTQRTYVHPTTATGNCQLCHDNVKYASENATQKTSVAHIPYWTSLTGGASMSCDASCHSGYVAWSGGKTNHNGTQGNGAGFCKNCHATGTSYLGTAQKMSLTHNKSTGVTDCSQSGCHKPLGSKGTPYTKWN